MLLNMKIKLNINKKLLFEFVSISFAVFLGLMLNQWKDNYNNNKLAKQSEINILAEIKNNKSSVQEMLDMHNLVIVKIDSALTLIENSKEYDKTDLDLSFKLISCASWETAKLTQAIVHMDINKVTKIAILYNFQQYYESIVKDYVFKVIQNKPEKRDKEYFEKMKNFLNAIILIENDLIQYYDYVEKEVFI